MGRWADRRADESVGREKGRDEDGQAEGGREAVEGRRD